jgi:hypothetical protein
VRLRQDADWHVGIVWRVPIHPIGGIGVALDLQVLDEARGGPAVLDQVLDLGPRHGIALDGSRVVDIIEPDRMKDLICLDGPREAAKATLQQANLLVQEVQDFLE